MYAKGGTALRAMSKTHMMLPAAVDVSKPVVLARPARGIQSLIATDWIEGQR